MSAQATPRRFRLRNGAWIGLLVACLLAALVPASELRPGNSRFLIGIIDAILFVPAGVGVASVLNFTSGQPGLRRAWLGTVLFYTIIIAAYAVASWRSARRYNREGRQVIGKVSAYHPKDHNQVSFTYRVGTKTYLQSESAPGNAAEYFSGAQVTVYYDRNDPEHAFLTEPRWQPTLVMFQWIIGAGLGPTFLLLGARVMGLSKKNARWETRMN